MYRGEGLMLHVLRQLKQLINAQYVLPPTTVPQTNAPKLTTCIE